MLNFQGSLSAGAAVNSAGARQALPSYLALETGPKGLWTGPALANTGGGASPPYPLPPSPVPGPMSPLGRRLR